MRLPVGWAPAGFDGLAASDFAHTCFGGAGSRASDRCQIALGVSRLTHALTDARIGLETMDTPAACRTFNILAAEGRGVVAALLL